MKALRPDPALRTAVLSADKAHRYALEQRLNHNLFGETRGRVLFVMLNPSKADAYTDDLTFTKCVGFASRWGFQDVSIGNLYPDRETHPEILFWMPNPPMSTLEIPEAMLHLERMAVAARQIVFAWGERQAAGSASVLIANRLFDLCPTTPFMCLGRTNEGWPRHPSRLGYDTELVPFQWFRRVRVEIWQGPAWRKSGVTRTPPRASVPVPYWIKHGSREMATTLAMNVTGVTTPCYIREGGRFLHKVYLDLERDDTPTVPRDVPYGLPSSIATAAAELAEHPDWHRQDLLGFNDPRPCVPYPTLDLDGTEEEWA